MPETAPPPSRRLIGWRILPLFSITALVIWVLVSQVVGADAFFATLRRARLEPLLAAVAVVVVAIPISILRWQIILRAMSYSIRYRECAVAALAVWPLAVIIPSRAGDVLRAVAIRSRVPFFEGAGSVVVEKAFDVQTLCFLALFGTLTQGFYDWAIVPATILAAAWVGVFLLFRCDDLTFGGRVPARLADKAQHMVNPLSCLLRSRLHLAAVLGTSLLSWLLATSILILLFDAFGSELGFVHALSIWPIAVFVGLLPLTVAGMGTRDAFFLFAVQATASATIAQEAVVAATLVYSLVTTWLPVAVGVPFAVRFAISLASKDNENSDDVG